MSTIRITKEFTFEMAHALEGYDGPCKQVHGHSYKLFVTVVGTPISDPLNHKYGMVMDFGDLKSIVNRLVVNRYDHALILRRTPANTPLFEQIKSHFEKVELVDYQPTCEKMIADFAADIARELPAGITLHHLKLHETATSYAEWYACDNK